MLPDRPSERSNHPVLRLIAARHARAAASDSAAVPGRWGDGARAALVIEGGGMRGAVSGGMALALDERGLAPVFDAVYGASSGALNAAWLLSGSIRAGMATYLDPDLVRRVIAPARALRRRPVIDMDHLVDELYEGIAPGFFERVAANAAELHPIATEVPPSTSVDLHSMITDGATVRRALRASAALPLLSGPPVEIDGHVYLDAGLADAIPFQPAIDDGATHVLVLRSRRAGDRTQAPGPRSRAIVGPMLRRVDPSVEVMWAARAEREGRAEDRLERDSADDEATPAMFQIATAADAPTVGRLERDTHRIRVALEAGHAVAHRTLAPAAPL